MKILRPAVGALGARRRELVPMGQNCVTTPMVTSANLETTMGSSVTKIMGSIAPPAFGCRSVVLFVVMSIAVLSRSLFSPISPRSITTMGLLCCPFAAKSIFLRRKL